MKTQVFLAALAALVVCAACAGAVAAPAPTPTPTPTKTPTPKLVPAPEPATTPDPLREELEDNISVCLLTSHQYLATIPVGGRVSSIMFHWVVVDSGPTHIHTIRMSKEAWMSLVGYEAFHFVSTYELTRNVLVDITIDGRRFLLSPSVNDCPPPIPGGMST